MIEISVPEYGRISRERLGSRVLRRLQTLDERHIRELNGTVFDWSNTSHIRALNYVGVIQVPGARIEILPKIYTLTGSEGESREEASANQVAKSNLVYMLSLTRDLPLRERDLAGQTLKRLPLLDYLILLFAKRLLRELRLGLNHAYVYREENLPYIKGKLLLSEHVRANVASRHLAFVGFDEFESNTLLNQILKAGCRTMLSLTRSVRASQYLKECLIEFADVGDRVVLAEDFDKVQLGRSSERFRPLLDFCEMILTRMAPTTRSGETSTFSLVFAMEQLFEEFIGRFVRKHASSFGVPPHAIHLQARRRRKWLLRTDDDKGKFRLKPDILIDGSDGQPSVILDTKWKRLKSDNEDSKNGVSQSDIYQLFAYATRYNCRQNVLLFPRVEGVTRKVYYFDGQDGTKTLRIEFVDVSRELATNQSALIAELQAALFGEATVCTN